MVDAIHQRSDPKLIIEVCIDSVESAVAAIRGGADRLELCGSLCYGGGTTPSIGLLQSVKKAVPNVPIMAMVRPRTGDFVYSEEEVNVMLHDIAVFKEYGVQGVVFGALTAAGDVDECLVREWTHFSGSTLRSLFPSRIRYDQGPAECMENAVQDDWDHKSIDKVTSFIQCKDVSSPEALKALTWMFDSASPLTTRILPGSGINISTIPILCEALSSHGLKEIHLSGGKWVDGRCAYRPDEMGMGVWSIWRTDEEAIRKVRNFVDSFRTAKTGGAWEP